MSENIFDILRRTVGNLCKRSERCDIHKIPLIPELSDIDTVGFTAHHIPRCLREVCRDL